MSPWSGNTYNPNVAVAPGVFSLATFNPFDNVVIFVVTACVCGSCTTSTPSSGSDSGVATRDEDESPKMPLKRLVSYASEG